MTHRIFTNIGLSASRHFSNFWGDGRPFARDKARRHGGSPFASKKSAADLTTGVICHKPVMNGLRPVPVKSAAEFFNVKMMRQRHHRGAVALV